MTGATPDLSVVILSTRADSNLPGAIESVIAQDAACEIIVVNSGGGDVRSLVARFGDRIKLVESAALLFAGGARNLGLTLASAPFIAFLACDCRAPPGWARRRIAHHRQGAAAVASSVMPEQRWNLVSWAEHLLLFPRRLPHLKPGQALRYSVSYTRALLMRHGDFDASLRIGEDTAYQAQLDRDERPLWDGDIVTLHRNTTSVPKFLVAHYRRGQRSGQHAFCHPDQTVARLVHATLKGARDVPSLAWHGLRGRDRLLALCSLPLYAVGLAARLSGIWSVRRDEPDDARLTFTRSPASGLMRRLRREPRIFAVFSFRFDAHLVPDLIANIAPVVDGWIALDDRDSQDLFSNETARRAMLIGAAWKRGADWILAIDPDERIERNARNRLLKLARKGKGRAWRLKLRELYGPAIYRIDGPWGKKRLARFFPAFLPPLKREFSLHARWFPDGLFKIRQSSINLYHLKMIAPARRVARSRLYSHLDPDGRFQKIGYDYLADEAGAVFETIPPGRGYDPPHHDDGGLWMPVVPEPGPPRTGNFELDEYGSKRHNPDAFPARPDNGV